ncbi:hypothetical protein GCM10027157_07590 [Corynebacterium aquatimens]
MDSIHLSQSLEIFAITHRTIAKSSHIVTAMLSMAAKIFHPLAAGAYRPIDLRAVEAHVLTVVDTLQRLLI